MHLNRFIPVPSVAIAAALVALSVPLLTTAARAQQTADFDAYSPGIYPGPLAANGLIATGSSGLEVADAVTNKVLGVPGGVAGGGIPLIDGAEWARFDFDAGAALAVSFRWQLGQFGVLPSPSYRIEGFDTAGNSLGIMGFTDFPLVVDVSGPFGGVPLSAFRVLGGGPQGGGDINVISITFTPTAVNVAPEPASLSLLVLTAFGIAGARVWRRQ